MARTSENLVAVSVVAVVTTAMALFFWVLDASTWAITLAVLLTAASLCVVLYVNWKIWGMNSMFVPWWFTAPLALMFGWLAWAGLVLPNLADVMNGEGLGRTLFGEPRNHFIPDLYQDFWWNSRWFKAAVELFFFSWTVIGFFEVKKRRQRRGLW